MNIQPTEINPQYIVRGDEIADTIAFFSDEACTVPVNVPAHTDIVMDLREQRRETGGLVARITKAGGGIGVVDNMLSYTFGGQKVPAKAYYTDIRLIVAGQDEPVTLCSRIIYVVNNITQFPVAE